MVKPFLSHQKIRSFVKREGRMTTAQKIALKTLWHHYGIDYSENYPLSFLEIFGRSAPVIVDVGSGTGDTTFNHAAQHPENDYIAIEVHRPGAGQLLRQIQQSNLKNIRIINHDVIDVFQHQIPENSIDEVFIFFPDPWPKKKHHKRRLIQEKFIALIKQVLKTNGRLFIATDWEDYANQILACCDNFPGLLNLAGRGNASPRPKWRRLTRYENRGKALNHSVRDFCYTK